MSPNKQINFYEPIDQLSLYGYDDYFISFKNLYEENKLPNTILLTGQKGIGKSTFAYHFIRYTSYCFASHIAAYTLFLAYTLSTLCANFNFYTK